MSQVEKDKLANGTMSPEEKDAIMREWKVGKYKEWVFDINHFNELAANSEKDSQGRIYKAAINHIRANYPEYNDYSGKQLIDTGIVKLFWKDKTSEKRKYKARKGSKPPEETNLEDFE